MPSHAKRSFDSRISGKLVCL